VKFLAGISAVIILLAGCSAADPAPEAGSTPESGTEQTLQYRVELTRHAVKEQTEDGVQLVSYSVHVPYLSVVAEDGVLLSEEDTDLSEDAQQALKTAETFNQTFDACFSEEVLAELKEAAEADFRWYREEGMDWHGGYYLELTCDYVQTEQMISVDGLNYHYTGGAHPNAWQQGWNFDLTRGVFFDPVQLGDGTQLSDAVAAEIVRQAHIPLEDGIIPAEWYWDDYESIIANWSCYAVTFDEAGMTVIFSPYELAAYAFGPQEFFIPYEFLQPHLNDFGQELLGLA